MNHEHARRRGEQDNGSEILGGVVGELGIEMRQDRLGPLKADEDRVTVRRRFGDQVGGEHAVCASSILHDDRGVGALLELLGEYATEDVRHPA